MTLPEEIPPLKPEDPANRAPMLGVPTLVFHTKIVLASSALFPELACTCDFYSYDYLGSQYPYRYDHLPITAVVKIQMTSTHTLLFGLLAVLYSACEGLSTAEGLGNIKNPRYHSQP